MYFPTTTKLCRLQRQLLLHIWGFAIVECRRRLHSIVTGLDQILVAPLHRDFISFDAFLRIVYQHSTFQLPAYNLSQVR